MFTLRQAASIRGTSGDPLPAVFKSLADAGTILSKGQLVIIVAAPGVGKSLLALTYVMKSGVSMLYFSADSGPDIQLSRALSIALGWPTDTAKGVARSGKFTGEAEAIVDNQKWRFNFLSSPTLEDLRRSLDSYNEIHGGFPSAIVVDNITNVRTELNADDPFAGLEVVMEELHEMARETGACVIGLHHVTGPFNDGDKPIPLSGVKGQISRVPEQILSLFRTQSFNGETLNVSTIKNRSGKGDPTGNTYVSLAFDGSRMQIKDQR